MPFTYIFIGDAQNEYEDSVKWYLQRSEKAAINFITAFDDTLRLICEHPYRWRNEYKNYRELGLKKYPFSIIYTVNQKLQIIIVIAVYHHKRNPRKKYK